LYLKHTPSIIKPLAKDLVFSIPNDQKEIYLTFDDGPHPSITAEVMEVLDAFQARATFFLIGQHAQAHPAVVDELQQRGHALGLHGYQHLSGWKTDDQSYVDEVQRTAEIVSSQIFRPPYGQITLSQAKHLKKDYRIIMWSDLSADFDARYSAEDCFRFATQKVKPGSIIVFHDSEKARPRMLEALKHSLEFYCEAGFQFGVID
jgi:peptidoglycan/xylan/chitin deacetylase (PgdA/CDA1 family)